MPLFCPKTPLMAQNTTQQFHSSLFSCFDRIPEIRRKKKQLAKVLFIFRCSENWQKKGVHHHLLANDGAHSFFANFYCSER